MASRAHALQYSYTFRGERGRGVTPGVSPNNIPNPSRCPCIPVLKPVTAGSTEGLINSTRANEGFVD